MSNSIRDHGTELGSNKGAKAVQCILLTHAVRITRNLACAELVVEYAQNDSADDEGLGKSELAEFLKINHLAFKNQKYYCRSQRPSEFHERSWSYFQHRNV